MNKEARRLYNKISRGSSTDEERKKYTELTMKPPPPAVPQKERDVRLRRQRIQRLLKQQNTLPEESKKISEKKRLYDRITFSRATEDEISFYKNTFGEAKVPTPLSKEEIETRKGCQRIRGLVRRHSKHISGNESKLVQLLEDTTKSTRWQKESKKEEATRKAKQVESTKQYRARLDQTEKDRQHLRNKLRNNIYRYSPNKSKYQLSSLSKQHANMLKQTSKPQTWRRQEKKEIWQQRLKYASSKRHATAGISAKHYIAFLEEEIGNFELCLAEPSKEKCTYNGTFYHSMPYKELPQIGPSECKGCRERVDMKSDLWNLCYYNKEARHPFVRDWFFSKGNDLLFKFHNIGSDSVIPSNKTT